jgi:hypothetical protein
VLKRIFKTYIDFDTDYLICPEESLSIYELIGEVDNYIDEKLKRFPLNRIQKKELKSIKDQFFENYLIRNEDLFKSKELLRQTI